MHLLAAAFILSWLAFAGGLRAESPLPPTRCQSDQTASLSVTATIAGKSCAGVTLVAVMAGPNGDEFRHGDLRGRATADSEGVAKITKLYPGKYLIATEAEYALWERGDVEFHPPVRIAEIPAGDTTAKFDFGVPHCAWCELEIEPDPAVDSIATWLRPLTVGAAKRTISEKAPESGPIKLTFGHLPAGRWELEIRRNLKNAKAGQPERPFRREIVLAAGEPQVIKLKLATFKLAGSLNLPSGALGDFCELRLLDAQFGWVPIQGTELPFDSALKVEKGKFDVGVLPQGDYLLFAKCMTKDSAIHACVFVSLGKDTSDLKIKFPSKSGDLKVKLDMGGRSVGMGKVRILNATDKAQVAAAAEFDRGDSGQDGALVFRTMPPGTYVVEWSGGGSVTVTEKVEVKAGKPCECTLTVRAATVVRIRPADFRGSLMRLTWVYEDKSGKPLAISMRAEDTAADSAGRDECFGRGIPEAAVRIRLMVDGYDDLTLPLYGTSGTMVEVAPKFERKK